MRKKIKKIVVDISKKCVFFRKFVRKSLYIYRNIRYKLCYKFRYKVDNKLILFEAYGGKSYACSPRAMYEEMIHSKKYKDYKFVWAFKEVDNHDIVSDERLTVVRSESKEYYKYLAMSKYWIVNSILPDFVTKKKNQVYVQCWHGTPLKRLRCDIEVNGSVMNTVSEIKKKNDVDAKRFDYFLSPSKFASEKFISAFNLKKLGKENIIVEKGYPRNDYLFKYTDKDVKRIKKEFGIPSNKKVIFYAPTFRDNQHSSSVGYTYNLNIDFDSLRDKFSKEYVILFRPHYYIANSFDFEKYEGFVYDASNYDDINGCYIISDILLTDYSSVFFDFANLKRPMLFYMYDLDEYKGKLRDFYLDLDELPGPIVEVQDDLEKEISKISNYYKKYKSKYDKFNKKYNYLDGNDCSKKVLEVVIDE
jgi:CDP-glycerol glycerophosphotransferase